MVDLKQVFSPPKLAMAMVIFLSIQGTALIGSLVSAYISQQDALSEVLQRVSLDTSRLDLGSEELTSVANNPDIARYIDNVNDYLNSQNMPIVLVSINTIPGSVDEFAYSNVLYAELLSNEQVVQLELRAEAIYANLTISYIAVFSVFVWLLLPNKKQSLSNASQPAVKTEASAESVSSQSFDGAQTLVVDLKKKELGLEQTGLFITLQNKPLCFYIALLKYCADNPNSHLNHQQPIPEELLNMANETFARLIELGHTKRKRPDFSANLDKTLSEIRAALDDIFASDPQQKEKYYPPRAQGEGSRSKQHSYALTKLRKGDVTFIEN